MREPEEPFLVVRDGKIFYRRHCLERGTRHIDRPQPGKSHGALHRQDAALPWRVEHRLVGFGLDRAEAVHPAHVVNRIHGAASSGRLASPVPIMLSRVTSVASRSSLQPSVPAGRIGTTMKRVSAVESQMRIWVSAGKVTPKSASTPFGSITARER